MLTVGRVGANFISRLIRSVIVSSRSRTLETSFSSPEILNSTLQESQLKFQKEKFSYHTFAQIQSFRTLGCSNARWSLGTLYCIDTFDPSNVSHPWEKRKHQDQSQGLETPGIRFGGQKTNPGPQIQPTRDLQPSLLHNQQTETKRPNQKTLGKFALWGRRKNESKL